MRIRAILASTGLALLAGALALGAEKTSAGSARKATPPAVPASEKNSCRTCIERRPVLDSGLFTDTRIYEPAVKASYEVARQMPATIDRLHCFCECAESAQFRHKTLLTCFTDKHAAGCGICIREAIMAADLKQRGASDDEVVKLVESMFKTDGHPPTHGMKR